MGAIIPLNRAPSHSGTIHVTGDRVDGFQVSHESSSGSSWGELHHFGSGADAIEVAVRLNLETYEGGCRIAVCDAALADVCGDVGPACLPGDF